MIFLLSNAPTVAGNGAFLRRNAATLRRNVTFLQGNGTTLRRNGAFLPSNGAFLRGNVTFLQRNEATLWRNVTFLRRNAAFLQGNGAFLRCFLTSVATPTTTFPATYADLTSKQPDCLTGSRSWSYRMIAYRFAKPSRTRRRCRCRQPILSMGFAGAILRAQFSLTFIPATDS